MADARRPAAALTVTRGPGAGRRFDFGAAPVTIGRQDQCEVQVEGTWVSRRHARLAWTGTEYIVEDLGSTNGTFVNGERVSGPRALRSGDRLQLGDQVAFAFETRAPVPGMAPSSGRSADPSKAQKVPAKPERRRAWMWALALLGLLVVIAAGAAVFALLSDNGPQADGSPTAQAAVPAPTRATATRTAAPTATATGTWTSTPTPRPTRTPTAAPTRTPTATRTRAPTPSPSPTRTRPPTAAPSPTLTRRLATGTVVKQTGAMNGDGELTVENGLGLDAVAVLSRETWLLAVYVQNNSSHTITGIPDGDYELFFTLGEDWDAGQGAFTRRRDLSRFEESFPFTSTSTTYSVWSVTLHAVPGGTASSQDVPESQFPNLTP
jgi:hypothetical protein